MIKSAIEEAKKRPGYSEEEVKKNVGMARTVLNHLY